MGGRCRTGDPGADDRRAPFPQADQAGDRRSTLSIGTAEHLISMPDCQLPAALRELKRRAPNVRPEISVMSCASLNQALRAGGDPRHAQERSGVSVAEALCAGAPGICH